MFEGLPSPVMGEIKTVPQYIKSAPAEMQVVLEELRTMIRSHLSDAKESMSSNGFAVYTIDDQWMAGFAWRQKGPMLYIMKSGVLDRYADQLGKLRSGRSCIEWKASKTMTLDELKALAEKMLGEVAESA